MIFLHFLKRRRIATQLRQHHSADPVFLAQVETEHPWTFPRDQLPLAYKETEVDNSIYTMAAKKPPSWKCAVCPRVVSGTDEWCGKCHNFWTDCYDPSFDPTKHGKQYAQWDQDPWTWSGDWTGQAPQTPRTRARTPSLPRTPKQPGNQEVKGKGKAKGKTKEPDWKRMKQAMPADAPVPAPTIDPAVRALMNSLKKSEDTLSEETKAALQDLQKADTQTTMKQMHHAVASLGKAKGSLEQAHQARNRLHSQWKTYIKDAVARWEKNILEFQEEDARLMDRISKARDTLQQAKEAFESTQRAQGVEIPAADNTEMEEEQRAETEAQASTQLDTGLQTMISNLKELQRQSEAISIPGEGSDSKRLKLSVEPSLLSAPSMKPFPKAGT